ncbi:MULTISPECIES: YqhR family membrane protein [Virgibacillus]|uniref:Membrane protein YqhR n=1 Tax=Virgibacillus kapii TaxID=1638645 RepID=A0ABQ2D663_9BACI|nr:MULTISPECIES: YqhR family membrane protein [Virgibacillus]EQB35992.1 hypothetical protein M948_13230 [Virgibacillus sp. CM-4]MYL41856.1 hypothetical protein [Virgibacillus massiliensis]GGJ47506.1 hypothetical protein GCM10007111_06900 [Virgibacillus kapii]
MKQQNQQLEQNKHENPMTILSRSLLTGFIGGIIWSIFATILYYFNFTEVAPKSFILSSWFHAEWIDTWLGTVITIIAIGLLSLVTALVYYGLLKKVSSIWMGVVFGIVLWIIIFYIMNPIFSTVPQVADLDMDTIVTTLCVFILYGTFIGYSISYDYHDLQRAKEDSKNAKA